MAKRPISERLEIIEMCIKAIWKVLDDDLDCSGATDYLDRAADHLDTARQAFREVRA